MTYTFTKAMGGKIGKSICEDDKLDLALDLMKKAKAGAKIVHCEGNYKKKNNRYEVNASIIKEESIGKIRNIKKLTKKQEEMIAPTTAQQ